MTDEAVTRDHWEADSSNLGPNLEGIQNTVITIIHVNVDFSSANLIRFPIPASS